MSVVFSVVISCITAALIIVFAKDIALVFGISSEILPTAVYAIRIYCTGAVFMALNIILSRYCQSREDDRSAFVGVLLKGILVPMPCIILFSLLGNTAVWFAFPVSEAAAFALFMLYYVIAGKKRVRFDESRVYRVNLSGKNAEISALLDGCEEFCDKWSANSSQKYCVMLVIEEIVTSIVRNALGHTPDGKIRITLIAMPDGDFTLHVLDNATEYNPLSGTGKAGHQTDFDIDEVSIILIKKKAKKYLYRQCTGFNSLTVQI